jgi:hypothetical protein
VVGGATCWETRDPVQFLFSSSVVVEALFDVVSLPSGYWISHRAIKCVYDAEDGLVTQSHDHTAVKNLIYEHFKVPICSTASSSTPYSMLFQYMVYT